jgi:uncharacterized repeat protein (TIGR03803 family)
VFKLAPDGTETVIHSFTGGSDGGQPYAGLVVDKAGNLYGTTSDGGDGTCNCGNVFKITPSGTETVLHNFVGGTDGADPAFDSMIIDDLGDLYGLTQEGGKDGLGTIFEVAPDGTETVLYAFKRGTDANEPEAGLIRDGLGNLYGMTTNGGASGLGAVFRLAADGKEKVLYSFTGSNDGCLPAGGLITSPAAGKGYFYSNTEACGVNGDGNIIAIPK